MEIAIVRKSDDKESTLGELYIDGNLFCATMEDTYRDIKIDGETRIPAGRYAIGFRHGSPKGKHYLLKYQTAGMIWLQNVPGFKYIYIHIGNSDKDTAGCILVGFQAITYYNVDAPKQRVLESKDCYISLHSKVSAALLNKEEVFLTIVDN